MILNFFEVHAFGFRVADVSLYLAGPSLAHNIRKPRRRVHAEWYSPIDLDRCLRKNILFVQAHIRP